MRPISQQYNHSCSIFPLRIIKVSASASNIVHNSQQKFIWTTADEVQAKEANTNLEV